MYKIDDNVYKYIVKRENFDTFIDLVKQYSEVRDRLICDFWNSVEVKLNSKNLGNWKVWLDQDILDNTSKLCLYNDLFTEPNSDASSCLITFERLSSEVIYGLWFNRGEEFQHLNFSDVCNYIKINHKDWKAGSGGWWFAAYQTTGDDFKNPDHLKRIIPGEHRDAVINEFADYLIKALKEFELVASNYASKFSNDSVIDIV